MNQTVHSGRRVRPAPGRSVKAPTRTNDPERTRADILEVATREFAEKGLAGARIDAIAEAMRTSKRMIYYYFGSKEGLYLAVLEESYRRMRAMEAEAHLDDLPPEDALRKLGSAGLGGINMETRLEDDSFNPVSQAGVPGEICGKGPHALMMYFKDPDKTEEAMKGGWFHSGDVGIMDEDRYITVADRKKDMIKTGGENVPTREVEEAIYLDPRVQEVLARFPGAKVVEVRRLAAEPPESDINADELNESADSDDD